MVYPITVQRQQVSVYFGSTLDFSIISLEEKNWTKWQAKTQTKTSKYLRPNWCDSP